MASSAASAAPLRDAQSNSEASSLPTKRTVEPIAAAATILVVAVFAGSFIALRGSRIEVNFPYLILAPISALLLLGLCYGPILKRDFRIAWACWFVSLCGLLIGGCALMQYAFGLWTRPEISAELIWADRALGLDWTAYATFIFKRPFISAVLRAAYNSLSYQAGLVILYVVVTDDRKRMFEYLLVTAICAVFTCLIFGLFPAQMAPVQYGRVDYLLDRLEAEQTAAILSGAKLVAYKITGLVNFPSAHTSGALIAIYLLRRTKLLYPIVALNFVMVLSVPPFGGHYFVDVIAGASAALASIFITRYSISALHRPHIQSAAIQAR